MKKLGSVLFFEFCLSVAAVAGSPLPTDCPPQISLAGRILSSHRLTVPQLVEIRSPGRKVLKANFIGERNGVLYFNPRATIATVKIERSQVVFSNLSAEAPAQALVDTTMASGISCAPGAVLGCLKILAEKEGLVSSDLIQALNKFPVDLFTEMNRRFGIESLEGESRRRIEEAQATLGRRALQQFYKRFRFEQHEKIGEFLRALRIPFKYTASVGELFKHLEKNYPAYLSVYAKTATRYSADLSHLPLKSVPWELMHSFNFPVPEWFSTHNYSVFAFSAIKDGWLQGGRRAVVVDTIGNTPGVWPEVSLRAFSGGAFILMYPQE